MKIEMAAQIFVKFTNIRFNQSHFIRSGVVLCVLADGAYQRRSAMLRMRQKVTASCVF
jgi:hypothetical protein